MIYREVFIEKKDDLSRIDRIYREKLGFTEKIYDLPRNTMISQIFLWIAELWFLQFLTWFYVESGTVVLGNGIFVDPKKVEAIVNWEQQKNVTKIQNFLGLDVL